MIRYCTAHDSHRNLGVNQAAWVLLANTASAELLSRRAGHFTLDADGQPQIDQLWVR